VRFIKKLDKKEKEHLNDLLRNSQNFKIRQRAHAILLSAKKIKIDELSEIFEVDRDTVSEWLNRWEEKGLEGLKDANRPGRPAHKDKSSDLKYALID